MTDTEPTNPRTGGCLCGAIDYRVSGPLRSVLHCHCENCRRITGNFMASSGCPTDALVVDDDDGALRWYDLGYAKYGFCTVCGSQLFWVGAEHQDHTSIAVGTIDDSAGLVVAGVWFSDEAQPHHELPANIPTFGGNGTPIGG